MDKVKFLALFLLFPLGASAQDVVFKMRSSKNGFYRNEYVEIEITNIGTTTISGYSVPEVWGDGTWRAWSWGPLDGKPQSLGTSFSLSKGKISLYRFTLKNVPQPPPAPDGSPFQCGNKLKFRLRTVVSLHGKERNTYSQPFYIYDEKNLVNGKVIYARTDCKR